MSQRALAGKLGVHYNTVWAWERGDYLPDTKAMVLEAARLLSLDEQSSRILLEASLTALAPYWLVPLPRNPFFTGREEILQALHTQLGVEQAVALTHASTLHGLGGIGKTQIALEYAYRYALEYSAVFWLAAETSETMMASFVAIAEQLSLPERQQADQQRIVAGVQRWLNQHQHWLLIWDNVEDLRLLSPFLPTGRQGAMLLTTRRQTLGPLAPGIELAVMPPEEALIFLLRRAGRLPALTSLEQMEQRASGEYEAAQQLVAKLGGLPLALDQVGAYVQEIPCSLQEYLTLYQSRRAALLGWRGEMVTDHPLSVVATWSLSFQQVEQVSTAAADLLQVCALLHPDAIPEELFTNGASHLGERLGSVAAERLAFHEVMRTTSAYSLLKRQVEQQTFSMHRLVQAVLRDHMGEQKQEEWMSQVISALNAVFPEQEPEMWEQCERLIPHVLACADASTGQRENQTLAEVLLKAANYLHQRAQYEQAEPLFLQALHIFEQALGETHPRVARSLNNLGLLYGEQGHYEQAEPLFLRALHIFEQALGEMHPHVAHPLNNLGLLYYEQGRYAQAEPLFLRALHIWEQALGEIHPQVARLLNNLGLLYSEQGHYGQAEPLFLRALHIWEQALDQEHPHAAYPLNGLASLYREQGRYQEAKPLYQQALSIQEQHLGPQHPATAETLHDLARFYYEQGHYEQAESLYQQALHIFEQALGEMHPYVARLLNNLGLLYGEQGHYKQAEPLFLRALHTFEQALGEMHPHMAHPLNGLASLYREEGRYQEAEPLYQRALGIREQHLGPQHPATAETLHDLARFWQRQGRLSEAMTLAQRALPIRSQALGENHPKTVATRTLYVQLFQQQ